MDSYQAIYDAVRSRISNGDIGHAVQEVAWRQFDVSTAINHIRDEFLVSAYAMQRPSVLYRPTLSADGNKWCALLGDDLMVGVAGFGDTPAEAMEAFDKAFMQVKTPAAARQAGEPQP